MHDGMNKRLQSVLVLGGGEDSQENVPGAAMGAAAAARSGTGASGEARIGAKAGQGSPRQLPRP